MSLAWKGGSLKAFADALNAKGGALLSASVVNDTTSTQVLLIEGKLTGSANRLSFQDKAVDLGVKPACCSGRNRRAVRAPRPEEPSPHGPSPSPADGVQVQDGTLVVNPGQELKIPVSPSVTLNKNMVLELSVKVEKLPEAAAGGRHASPGADRPADRRHRFQGHPHRERSLADAAARVAAPQAPRKHHRPAMPFHGRRRQGDPPARRFPIPTDFQKIQVPIGELASTLDAIDLRNRNTYRQIDVKDITIFDKTQRGDYAARQGPCPRPVTP